MYLKWNLPQVTGKNVLEVGGRLPDAGVTLDVSALRPGIYFVKLQTG